MNEEQHEQHTINFLLRTGIYEVTPSEELRVLLRVPMAIIKERCRHEERVREAREMAANCRIDYKSVYRLIKKGRDRS